MLIPVPKNPTNDIDVYLQPLIDELGDLCLDGTLTYDDASIKEKLPNACSCTFDNKQSACLC